MKTSGHIITIYSDYDFYLIDGEDSTHDLSDLRDKAGMPIVMPEMYEWGKEMSPIVIASETEQAYEKNWADYHKRGQELARKLRRCLVSSYELWYKAINETAA